MTAENDARGGPPDIVARLMEFAGERYPDDICGKECMAEAAAEIERLRAAQAWQPIETAPRDGTEVIMFGHGCLGAGFYEAGGNYRRGDDGWWWEMDRGDLLTAKNADPTHWRPLPDPPA